MLNIQNLTKRYGDETAVDDLSFTVRPGVVTGFLGPNGAGKTTTLRILLGLAEPASGRALIGDRRYGELRHPLREVGALLDATALHPERTAINHLRCLARSNNLEPSRALAVLERVGLAGAARKRAGKFSLGMKQRLGIAAALLGDPAVLVLDEPVNGLDPDGVLWLRQLLRELAADGRTVFLSSHLMSEMERAADELVLIGRGRLIEHATTADLTERFGGLETAYTELTRGLAAHSAQGTAAGGN